jgi:hypothetical protein
MAVMHQGTVDGPNRGSGSRGTTAFWKCTTGLDTIGVNTIGVGEAHSLAKPSTLWPLTLMLALGLARLLEIEGRSPL